MIKKAVFIGVVAVFTYQLAGYLWDDQEAVLGNGEIHSFTIAGIYSIELVLISKILY